MIKIISGICIVLLLPLLVQSVDAVNQTGIMASVTIKSNIQTQTSAGGGDSSNGSSAKGVESTPQGQEDSDPGNRLDHTIADRDYTDPSDGPTAMQDHYKVAVNVGNDIINKNEIRYLTAEQRELPLFSPEMLGIPVAAAITGSVVTALMISNAGGTGSFNLKPVGFSAAALKSYSVARKYQALFRKTQTPLALAFLSLASGSIMNFFGFEIASYVLYGAFYGLVAYHLSIWHSTISYSRVTKEIQQLLIILPILGLLGYLYLLATEMIQYDIFQVITVIGLLAITPLTIFTSLTYRGSRLYLKWILASTGLVTVMAGLALSSVVWVGDTLVLLGCGNVIIAQTILSAKFAVVKG